VQRAFQVQKKFEIASQLEILADVDRNDRHCQPDLDSGLMIESTKPTNTTRKIEEPMMSFTSNPTKTFGRYPMCPAATNIVNHDSNVKEESP
jgi:hypothetical protein